jgi:hypothetical protein
MDEMFGSQFPWIESRQGAVGFNGWTEIGRVIRCASVEAGISYNGQSAVEPIKFDPRSHDPGLRDPKLDDRAVGTGVLQQPLSPQTSNRHLQLPEDLMKIAIVALVAGLALVGASSADAKGCIKGAVIGGVAGHYVGHHGMLGAAAGCLYGRHRAHQQERQQEQQNQTTGQGKS